MPLIGVKKRVVLPIARMLDLLSVLSAKKPSNPSHTVEGFATKSFLGAEVGTCFQYQNANPCFSKGLSCHSPRCTGTDHDGFKSFQRHSAYADLPIVSLFANRTEI